MKRIHTTVVVGIIASLVGCASSSTQYRYYSLVLASDSKATEIVGDKADNSADARMIVGPIQLARYLDQPGLPIQVSESQIQKARHHFWAEDLDEAIVKVLVQEITRHTDSVVVERDAGRWTPEAQCRVRVEFDKFHATSDSSVMAAGRYWIHRINSSAAVKKDFDIVRTLSVDGYAHAVRQLRSALVVLAIEIAESAEVASVCTTTTEQAPGMES